MGAGRCVWAFRVAPVLAFGLDEMHVFEMAAELGLLEEPREVGVFQCIVGGKGTVVGAIGDVEVLLALLVDDCLSH